MALINVPDIQNLDAATPELFNSRFGTIANEINGNLDANNLKDGAVTSSKLATGAVTTGKITDANVTPAKWTNPYKFFCYRNTALTVSNPGMGIVNFDAVLFDTNSNYSTSTGLYTAPVAGFYRFSWMVYTTSSFVYFVTEIAKNGTAYSKGVSINNPSVTVQFGSGATVLMQLAAGDTVQINAQSNGAAAILSGTTPYYTNFCGTLETIT